MIQRAVLGALLLISPVAACWGAADDSFERQFLSPPASAKPWCYWWWLNGCVSKDGIVRDLDMMKLQGIAGALVFQAGKGETPFRTMFLSTEWRVLFRYAVEEAAKRQIVIGLNVCDGWNAGGPWVSPDLAAKTLVHGSLRIDGPKQLDAPLPAPSADASYQDIAVLAWPLSAGDAPPPAAKLTASSSYPGYGPELSADGDPATRWISKGNTNGEGPRADRPEYLQWSYAETFSAAAMHITPYKQCGPQDCQLQVSDDGTTFRTIARIRVQPKGPQTFPFAETGARCFRLLVTTSYLLRGTENRNVQIGEAMLLRKGEKPIPAAVCPSRGMLDLTTHLDKKSHLQWNVPDGRWIVIRFGYQVSARAKTKCTTRDRYLEIDPLSRAAMDRHFAATAGIAIGDVGPHAGQTFKYLHIDSGEIGEPDWTPNFRVDFQRTRGYNLLPYLAAKAGHIVDDPAKTERFLEDYQRTIGDLMIECYYGRLGELAHQHGLATHSEAAGYQKPMVDALRSMGCNDVCMSEFWSRRPSEPPYIHQLAAAQLSKHDGIKNAASAAHIYGRKIVQAEAFTVMRATNYDQDPFALKDVGDRAFCAGLNRTMLCFVVSQPEEQSKPGYEWPGVGMEFSRHVTWSSRSSAWLAYLARCQFLLQAGRFAADVCYLQGEWVPAYVPARWAMNPPLPFGFDCDTINADVLASRADASADGRLELPDGPCYRYLALCQGGASLRTPQRIFGDPGDFELPKIPETGSGNSLALSPATLQKLTKLVEAGVTLIGPPPKRAIGLNGYPQCDGEIRTLVDALWGPSPGSAGERRVGRGRVIWGRSLAQVFAANNLSPDLEIRESPATAALSVETLNQIPNPGSFDWIHRTIANSEVYFIANLRNATAEGEFVFRVAGHQPELWDPVTGAIRNLPEYRSQGNRTAVSLAFSPRQSVFVVFRRPAEKVAASTLVNCPRTEMLADLIGSWEVAFDPKWGGPEKVTFDKLADWTTRPEEGIKYYSGTATYRKRFALPSAAASGRSPLYLDLGTVKNLAEVRLNGISLGVVWTAPWRIDISEAVHPLDNVLEIDVVNLWPNRLIGDAGQPPEKRFTTTNVVHFKRDLPLLPSGLLGPVTIQTARAGERP